MGMKVGGVLVGTEAEVETTRGLRVVPLSRGTGFALAVQTPTLNAALAAGTAQFAMRLSPTAGTTKAYIERLKLTFQTIVAFTTPVIASRSLGVYRGYTAAMSAGTAVAVANEKDSSGVASQFDAANGGDIRFAPAAGLTLGTTTFDANPLHILTATHVGAAGGFVERTWEMGAGFGITPIILNAGELLVVRNIPLMDAAGTWQLAVDIDWMESILPV